MNDFRVAPSVVVGVDGSRAALRAAVWAVDEAVSRDVPLRLIYVTADHRQFADARVALNEAQRAAEASGQPVKVETEILRGEPLATLARESRTAVMVCVGSIGIKHACHGVRSVAAALPGSARCPVAVIRASQSEAPTSRSVVVEADNGVVLRRAFEEARLRGAVLRTVGTWRAEAPDAIADGSRLVRAQLNRQIARWTRWYPDVKVEPMVVRGALCDYLAKNTGFAEVFVSGRGDVGRVGCSVLTVPCSNL
ncbi:universal stress protein [Mycobacterium kyorinense]|uniref:UspA domain-containing protein n=1 Tax=Mycobacterium kyorinense TaxID=487514 RepID=A0A1X1XJX9_9MYCO|nr:universal stress protein [Mycobacterium kyorinense]ORV99043.1 hypothetical protein AWC14_12515 [Mycobacterium kyorinense]